MPNHTGDGSTSDVQLLEAVAVGDDDAFALFVHRHIGALLRFCRTRLEDYAAAEDAAQEAMLRVFQQARSGEVPVEPFAWLLAVARNCCNEQRRRCERQRALPLVDATDVHITGHDDDLLAHLLETLTDEQRSLIFMKHTEGLTCREIAAHTGKPIGTVTSALSRAYAKLREGVPARREKCDDRI